MKTMALSMLALASSLACGAVAGAQLVCYDGFTGSGNLSGQNGGTGWASAWADVMGATPTSIVSTGMGHGGLAVAGGCAKTGTSGSYPQARLYRAFPTLPTGTTTLYVSFLLRADAGYGSWGGLSFGTYPYAMYVGSPLGMYSYGLMMSEGLGDVSNAPLVQGVTKLLVCKITKNNPTGVSYKLYVDPNVGGSEPSFPDAAYTLNMLSALPPGLNIDNEGGFSTDEIRVGLTWSSVLPAAAPACPGDLNHSHAVDAADLSILLGQWGLPGGDLNDDGTTDAADLAILLGHWGSCTG
ncbi:MAG: hypothetical protein U0572_03275 [Phycisphaerales bacterium]